MKYHVGISGVGVKDVEAKSLDDAYDVACKEYGCSVRDILMVMGADPSSLGEFVNGEMVIDNVGSR